MILTYNFNKHKWEYEISDKDFREYIKKDYTPEELINIYLDNYYDNESYQEQQEIEDMYSRYGGFIQNPYVAEQDAYKWILDIVTENKEDFKDDYDLLEYFRKRAYLDYIRYLEKSNDPNDFR